MSKSTDKNTRVKRRLIDDLNQTDNAQFDGDSSKRLRINRRLTNEDEQIIENHSNPGPQGMFKGSGSTSKTKADNDLLVRIVTNKGKNLNERVVVRRTQVQEGHVARVDQGHSNHLKQKGNIKSKIVIPTKTTRSRVIKPPARFLDSVSDKKGGYKNGKKVNKLSKKDINDYNVIDTQTNTEISEGNAVATPGRPVEHDGVELSVNGSDLDEFSDEEIMTVDTVDSLNNQNSQRNEQQGEPGEILSSGEDDEHPIQGRTSLLRRLAASKTTKNAKQPSSRMEKFKHLRHDPDFNEFLDQVLDKKLSEKKGKGMNTDNANQNATIRARTVNNIIKSPSDTTLYTPALKRGDMTQLENGINAIEKISNFVESIRIDGNSGRSDDRDKRRTDDRLNSKRRLTETPSTSGRQHPAKQSFHDAHQKEQNEEDAERTADHLILQAEKFKARVEAPKGMNDLNGVRAMNGMLNERGKTNMLMPYDYEQLRTRFVTDEGLAPIDSEILFLRNFDQDDEFFHVTSQIEPGLKAKIEKGEFIDLDKLLPKDKFSSGLKGNDELNKHLFQLITQGTNSYMGTADHHRNANKINSIKKWDQAFRVYAAIYTQANPNRAGEIWQYIYIIHTAATSNPWENVAFYDITFRELMASKPWRNWGKTYTQGWNMAFNNNHNFSHGSSNNGNNGYNRNHQQPHQQFNNSNNKDWKDDCCWRFNKNKCKRTASECRYDHRCTHCAGWYHSYNNCRKRNRNNNGGNKSNTWGSYNNNAKTNSTSPVVTTKQPGGGDSGKDKN